MKRIKQDILNDLEGIMHDMKENRKELDALIKELYLLEE
jgi:hypothetical protein